MCQYVETMCAVNGIIELIDYHNERLNRTRHELFGCNDIIVLNDIIHPDNSVGCLKVRVVYDASGVTEVSYSPYTPKKIHYLRIVTDDDIDYRYKSTNRTRLQSLASMKGDCDEVLIVRNGLITDTSYTNVAVNINDEWYTPRLPLLKGTRRASLLDKGIIKEKDIYVSDINEKSEIMLFNGMMDFGTCKAFVKIK